MTLSVLMQVNACKVEAQIDDRLLLSDFLRDQLHLKSVHIGCDLGSCGACTIMIDGKASFACLTLVAQCENSSIVTLEGLAKNRLATKLKAKLSQKHGLQCGYCTPGIIVCAISLAHSFTDSVSREEVRAAIDGNLCRCTGYSNIVDAIEEWLHEIHNEATA